MLLECFLFLDFLKRNRSCAVQGRATNNIAEILAIVHAINIASSVFGLKDITIKTDSEFVVKSYYNYMHHWAKNGWRKLNGTPVKNKKQFLALRRAVQRNFGRMHIQLKHIKGHNHIEDCNTSQQKEDAYYNGLADKLAHNGTEQYIIQNGLQRFYN